MHVLWETDRWLQKYCVSTSDTLAGPDDKTDGSKAASDSEDKALSASGGGGSGPEGLEQEGLNVIPRSSLW